MAENDGTDYSIAPWLGQEPILFLQI